MCIKITEKTPFENQVYHYCSLETFRLIVENKVLFMSDYHYMNDSSEEKYFLDVFETEMKNLYDGLSDEEKANIESDDYMKNIWRGFLNYMLMCALFVVFQIYEMI